VIYISMDRAEMKNADFHVSRQDLEGALARVEQGVNDPRRGIFGPESMSWKIDRESALFLAAGRAALLQLAHPWVAAALAQHSSLLQNPIARFHNTFRIVFTMVFGSAPQALSAARSLHQLHTHIRGEISLPGDRRAHYEANYIPALKWVYATLVDSAVLAYECVLPSLTARERDEYFLESKVFASLFGIPAGALPEDWAGFSAYMSEVFESSDVAVDSTAIALAEGVLAGAGSWVRPPEWYRALTAEWMPQRLRVEFGLTYGQRERRAADSARKWLPKLYRRLPPALRFTGAYHEACARIESRNPGPLTRGSNRFWIGQPLMPFNSLNGNLL
jgi:uncharacterized protein (DUF2236 family)